MMLYPRGALLVSMLMVLASCGGGGDERATDAAVAEVDAAPPAPIRILPLGDSLTLGFGSNVEGPGSEPGYRMHLIERLRAGGLAVDFVGSQSNGPAELDDKDHEGHSGYAVPQIAELAGDAMDQHQPQVVLLMAGTNDQIEAFPPSQPPADAAADMEALVALLDERASGVQIVLAQVIPLTLNDEGVVAYNALLPGIVERQRARGVNLRLVDMYAIGTENLSGDGIHPTQTGYDMMADIWYAAVMDAIAEL